MYCFCMKSEIEGKIAVFPKVMTISHDLPIGYFKQYVKLCP